MKTHELVILKNDGTQLSRTVNGVIPAVGATVTVYDTDGQTTLTKTVSFIVYDFKTYPKLVADKTPAEEGRVIVKVTLAA